MENQQEIVEKQKSQEKTQENQVLYGGFWARLAASFIDGIIVNVAGYVVIIPLGIIFGSYSAFAESAVVEGIVTFLNIIISLGITFGYYIYSTYKYQATLGKMALGIRVLNEQGEKPTLGQVALRETIGKLVSGITLGVGYLMVAFTDKKQGLHDMIGNTIVVAKDQEKGVNKIVVIVVNVCFIGFYTFLTTMLVVAILFFGMLMASEGDFDDYLNNYDYEDCSSDYSEYEDYLNY